MMGKLKGLHSPDVPSLSTWVPESAEFAILIQIVAGPPDSPGEESFDVTLCTPGWVKAQAEREGVFSARHHLIVVEYSYDKVYQYISKYLSTCTGSTWNEVAMKISRLGHWEFEDYRQ